MDLSRLNSIETDFPSYLEGDDVTRFLDSFGIRFAAGHWCAGNFFDRFCTVGYNDLDSGFEDTLVGQVKRVRQAGIDGIEFHEKVFMNPESGRNDAEINAVKDALFHYKVTPTNMNFMLWAEPKYKFGSITHPDPGARKVAREQVKFGIDLAKEMGFVSCGLWPGSDGWDYHFEVDYGQRWVWFIDALTEAAAHCDSLGLKFGTEPKQKEPREMNMITNTVAKAACACIQVNNNLGKTVMGVAIDYGHEQMVGNTPAESLYFLKQMGLPIANFHLNGAKYNSNDEDRIAGTDDIWRMVEFCYAAVDTGYDGWFGLDQFTYRTEQVESMALSREFFANSMKKALKIYAMKDKLAGAQGTGDAGRVIQLIKRVMYTG